MVEKETTKRKGKVEIFPFLSKIFFILLFIAGIAVVLYPFYRDSLNNALEQAVVRSYQEEQNRKYQEEHLKLLEKNRQSQEQTKKALADPFSKESLEAGKIKATIPSTKELTAHTLGVIYIPKIDQQLPIYDSTEEKFLSRGASWVSPSDLPTGGVGKKTVISAHRGLPTAKLFTDLPNLVNGDIFIIEIQGEYHAYKVVEEKVVEPQNSDALLPEKGRDLATLLTCTPYMINSHRLLVTGERTPFTPNMLKAMKQIEGNQNWKAYLLYAFMALVVIGAILLARLFFLNMLKKSKYYQLRFKVLDEQDAPLANAEYQLYDAKGRQPITRSGEVVKSTIDESGVVTFEEIPGMPFTVKQVQTPTGFKQIDTIHFVVKKVKDQNFKGKIKRKILSKEFWKNEKGTLHIKNPKAN